ncbi:CDP-diacylglycerol--serine O-phosphatidyltransferase [Methylopila jiangsuensis]|uniref:CDP-diacylglycerol--serine O-phosphatidyltransferase n=1 Tax=Methylopila jiangsuensis TaxID=586230 RepID=A0A9W6JHL3_9HYPH|nr:phosphatidylcholine/phosphatidylserine synthase [Methylopila jiangsuensis]MDR6286159.1 CDP-diacylglycerol--serine O-phosphatidyltransferase [Methylopila jiangsuensis]GLK75919.1 CDP-diacylglycerol--serine O-phosphatidyltransferase [Methylopila jiangsuensis]
MDEFRPAPEPQAAGRRSRLRFVPLRLLLPNLVTLLALCAGLTGVRMAIEGRLELAVYLVVLAGALDGVDGRLARLLKGTSRFGAELDSLADFVSFGVVPALILYVWGLNGLGHVGWIGGLIFAIAAALRLARFNVALDDPNKPAWAGQFFVGVPAPAGAILSLLPIYLEFLGFPRTPVALPLVLVYVLGVALLMVSPLPTWSGKKLGARVHRAYVAPLLIAAALLVTLLVSYPWLVLTTVTLAYLATIPFAILHQRRLIARDRAAATKAG